MKHEQNTSFLEPGTLEAYCLGTLTEGEAAQVHALVEAQPALQQEVEAILQSLQQYATAAPRVGMRSRVLNFLNPFLQQAPAIDLNHPPVLHLHSDTLAWNKALSGVEPDIFEPEVSMKVIHSSEDMDLCVVWLSGTLTEEGHYQNEFSERFLLLEGACECDFDGQYVRYSAGDYFEVPPNTRHVIRNISDGPYVKGLIQRLKKAA